ncbi:arsenic resistance N-acetyltransferase ArsN2 [Actomonas aquatica]|uniref:Arsenic resistance N-acetyltransferase ArsN2 n=1 Tax=Actomonas aquatica TaxID=2866162 RepID=A0ABZ1C4M8_9BACT|nr:arsenic resistance N-acetyltransferase ArsN2 [Opitutus sp. WL0086]WRQ86681.1 arsenic resistance N-acetyltransferase ArsN2 [Opitutus sp. WL0086]
MPLPPLTYELAETRDGPAITALLRAVDLPTEDLTTQSWRHFIVARADARVIGAAGLEPTGEVALLRSFVVTPDLRGAGIGQHLLTETRQLARQPGVQELWLLTTTAETFFARAGFTRVPRETAPPAIQASREYCALCPASAAVMTAQP